MASVVVRGTGSPVTIPGLGSGTYSITVAAENKVGAGSATAPIATTVLLSDPAPDWAEDFDTLDLKTATNTNGRWLASSNYVGNGLQGYADEGSHNTWNANPNQDFGGSVAAMNPFTVGAVAGANGSALTITCQPYTSAQAAAVAAFHGSTPGSRWGGILISNENVRTFTYGYFEWRMRLPTPGSGMWPALWLFAPQGQDPGKTLAEMDMLEVFGYPSGQPWTTTMHAGNNDPVGTWNSDTTGWHTYGVDWRANQVDFYKDRVKVGSASAADAAYMNGLTMAVRMNYTVTSSSGQPWAGAFPNSSTPNLLTMDVDYFHYWVTKPFPLNVPSGVSMPTVSTKPGWTYSYGQDFNTNAPLGQFAAIYGNNWAGYGATKVAVDTSKNGTYRPDKTLSVAASMLDIWIHYDAATGLYCVASPFPQPTGAANGGSQDYANGMRTTIRFTIPSPIVGYKTAWMLYASTFAWNDGEIDFPEGNMNAGSVITAANHYAGVGNPGGYTKYSSTTPEVGGWHTAVTEWIAQTSTSPGSCSFYLDGVLLGTNSVNVPSNPMHWNLQTETNIDGQGVPNQAAQGHISIDWLTVESYTG